MNEKTSLEIIDEQANKIGFVADIIGSGGINIFPGGCCSEHDNYGLFLILSEIQQSLEEAMEKIQKGREPEEQGKKGVRHGKKRTVIRHIKLG